MLADARARDRRAGLWLKRWGPAAGMMAFIFILSSRPTLPDFGLFSIVIEGKDYSDKLKHFIAYALLGALIWRALRGGGWRRVGATVLIGTLYGLTDEIHQIYVPGRSFEFLDIAADGLGAFTAAAVLMLFKGGVVDGKRR